MHRLKKYEYEKEKDKSKEGIQKIMKSLYFYYYKVIILFKSMNLEKLISNAL